MGVHSPLLSIEFSAPSVVLVEDEDDVADWTLRVLEGAGIEQIVRCREGAGVAEALESSGANLVLLDLGLPDKPGEDVLADLVARHPSVPVVVVTARQDVESAVSCMKLGATDFLTKPYAAGRLVATIERVMNRRLPDVAAAGGRGSWERSLTNPEAFRGILTEDVGMARLFRRIETVARASGSVLVCGETGSGKELVARAIHACSGREGPLVAVNVGGYDDALFADALFGHEAGAFTGAAGSRPGFIAEAEGGTIFLDEIGDLPEGAQVKLLRLIQEGEYYAVGSNRKRKLGARVIAATHRDTSDLRPDLYYRLSSFRVDVPPLRRRLGDIPLLVEHFVQEASRELGVRSPEVPARVYSRLASYSFPGNVRELRSMVFDAMVRLTEEHERSNAFLSISIPTEEPADGVAPALPADDVVFPHPMPSMKAIGQAAVTEALRRTGGNRTRAASILDVSRPTIARYAREAEAGGDGA